MDIEDNLKSSTPPKRVTFEAPTTPPSKVTPETLPKIVGSVSKSGQKRQVKMVVN